MISNIFSSKKVKNIKIEAAASDTIKAEPLETNSSILNRPS